MIIYGQFTAIRVFVKTIIAEFFEHKWPQIAHEFP